MTKAAKIQFNSEDTLSKEFSTTLNKRVNAYFKDKGISKNANAHMYIKTVAMLAMYFVPFCIILFVQPSNWIAFILSGIVGLGMAGIGLGIMHDAIHGGYSSSPLVNKIMGYTLNLVGANAINWRIQHNINHHTYTNVDDHDEDIAPKAGLRLSPNSERKPFHRFQHIYGWLVYCLGSLFWVTFKDFIKFNNYLKDGSMKKNAKSVTVEVVILLFTKIFYWSYIIGLPLYFTNYSGGEIAIGFLMLHFCSGLALAVIFQPAHLMEDVEYPNPNDEGKMKYSWIVHQLYTTTNYAGENPIVNWYGGGLNFQIEHHLFPHICHVHYKGISPIVKQTAKEFDLPYYSYPTFFEALAAHTHQLKLLGTT